MFCRVFEGNDLVIEFIVLFWGFVDFYFLVFGIGFILFYFIEGLVFIWGGGLGGRRRV